MWDGTCEKRATPEAHKFALWLVANQLLRRWWLIPGLPFLYRICIFDRISPKSFTSLIYNTRGIILHCIKYSESSVIAKTYTELFGIQSYMINGVRAKKSKKKPGLLQPLTMLNMTVYHKKGGGIQRIKSLSSIPQKILFSPNISNLTISLFIAEVLYKSIKEEEPNKDLFEFLIYSLENLKSDHIPNNFHIFFLLQLSKFLGFYPSLGEKDTVKFFDKREGIFSNSMPEHPDYIARPESMHLSLLLQSDFEGLPAIQLSAQVRKELLDHIVNYYEHHIPGMSKINSHHVLSMVFS